MKFLINFIVILFSTKAACVSSHKANIRAEAQASSQLITTLRKYTPISILETKSNWLKVKGYNFEGWIYNSLIDTSYNCMTIKKMSNLACSTYGKTIKREVSYLENFKIIRMKIGCNYVQDQYGKRYWISNLGTTSSSSTKLINIQ